MEDTMTASITGLSGEGGSRTVAVTLPDGEIVPCDVLFSAYCDNERLAVMLAGSITGEAIAKASVNVEDALADDEIAMKFWGENEIIRAPLLASKMFTPTDRTIPCGHTDAEVWLLIPEVAVGYLNLPQSSFVRDALVRAMVAGYFRRSNAT